MNKLDNVFKIIFHFSNIVLIVFYLFPGSLLGWFLYKDLEIQPQVTNDFIGISSNHFYAFFALSFVGILSYSKHKKFDLLIKYLLLLSVLLELSHLLIPVRGFEFGDLFGNILGVVLALLVNKIWRQGFSQKKK